MKARFVLFSAALISVSASAADAPKPPVQPANQPQSAPQQIVLASADVHSTVPDAQSPAPPKHPRIARVTTCRCGGQEPGPSARPDK